MTCCSCSAGLQLIPVPVLWGDHLWQRSGMKRWAKELPQLQQLDCHQKHLSGNGEKPGRCSPMCPSSHSRAWEEGEAALSEADKWASLGSSTKKKEARWKGCGKQPHKSSPLLCIILICMVVIFVRRFFFFLRSNLSVFISPWTNNLSQQWWPPVLLTKKFHSHFQNSYSMFSCLIVQIGCTWCKIRDSSLSVSLTPLTSLIYTSSASGI